MAEPQPQRLVDYWMISDSGSQESISHQQADQLSITGQMARFTTRYDKREVLAFSVLTLQDIAHLQFKHSMYLAPPHPGHGRDVVSSIPGSLVMNFPEQQHCAHTSLPLPSQYGQFRLRLSFSCHVKESREGTRQTAEREQGSRQRGGMSFSYALDPGVGS